MPSVQKCNTFLFLYHSLQVGVLKLRGDNWLRVVISLMKGLMVSLPAMETWSRGMVPSSEALEPHPAAKMAVNRMLNSSGNLMASWNEKSKLAPRCYRNITVNLRFGCLA